MSVRVKRADGSWQYLAGVNAGGAPTTADYLVETADATLSAEVVTGTTYMTTAAQAARQAAAKAGRLFLPSNGFILQRDAGAAWARWGPLFPFTEPDNSQFAWTNQGGSSVDTTNGGIFLSAPTTAGTSWRCRTKTLGANTRVEIGLLPHMIGVTPQVGLVLRESATGKLATLSVIGGASVLQFAIQHWASATAFGGNDLGGTNWNAAPVVWLAASLSGANILYHLSTDGQHWIQVLSIAKTTQFTTAPNEWGIAVEAAAATYDTGMTLLSFKET